MHGTLQRLYAGQAGSNYCTAVATTASPPTAAAAAAAFRTAGRREGFFYIPGPRASMLEVVLWKIHAWVNQGILFMCDWGWCCKVFKLPCNAAAATAIAAIRMRNLPPAVLLWWISSITFRPNISLFLEPLNHWRTGFLLVVSLFYHWVAVSSTLYIPT